MLILADVLIEALDSIRHSGIQVDHVKDQLSDAPSRHDGLIRVSTSGCEALFVVELKGRTPFPNELVRLAPVQHAISAVGHPLLVVPFVPESLEPVLTETGWSWADAQGNFNLRAPSMVLRQRRTYSQSKTTRTALPQGSGSLAVIRALIDFRRDEDEELGASALAKQTHVSQPRVSQVLHQLRDLDLVELTENRRWRPNRESLIDRFLSEYSGPKGSEIYFYSLSQPTDTATLMARCMPAGNLAISADVGPDLIAPWRRPSLLIAYTRNEMDEADIGGERTPNPHDANVIVRMPDDLSVFPRKPLTAHLNDTEIPLTDPMQMIWDLRQLGGADREEAAGVLRDWLLANP